MAFNHTDTLVGAQPIAVTSTTQQHVIGQRVKAFDPTYGECEFIYMLGVANTIAGSLAMIDETAGTTTLTLTATRGTVGVAMAAIVAANYGWYMINGTAPVACNAAVVAQAPVYATATAGKVDDAVVAGSGVTGAVFKTADGTPAANFAVVSLSNPSMSGLG